jgi:hypothetical protein
MNILSSYVPAWVSILFLLMLPVPIFMIANAVKQGAVKANFDSEKVTWVFRSIFIFYAIYFIYVFFMSSTGIFLENSIPPRVLLYTTFPLILFFIFIVSRLKVYRQLVENVPLQTLVLVHSFRFIGIIFIIIHSVGGIPARFAYVAGIGDIITAILSFVVAKAITTKKSYARPLTYAWNFLGLMDVISILVTANITTKLAITTGSQGLTTMGSFPFSLIAAYAPPTIIFLHITIFRKLWMERKQKV